MGKKADAADRMAAGVERMAVVFETMERRDKYVESLREQNESLLKEIAELKVKLQKPLG